MRLSRKSGSVGALGVRPSRATRPTSSTEIGCSPWMIDETTAQPAVEELE
jgi:hypothetical protein